MHQIGDKIMYGAVGVMTIVDIREESIGDISRSYYVLRPTLARSESFTFVPTDNERLVSFMRPLLTKDEIVSLIHSYISIAPLDWINENRARQEYFKKVMESGDRAQIIAMIHTIDECGKRREAEGKKNFLADENIRHKAKKLLYSEVAVVYDIPEEDVETFIKNIIG